MSTYRDKAIVLRVRESRDHDRLYSVFTHEHGKLTLLAKGLRRIRSKMSPHMATFGVVEIMVANGKLFDRLAGANLIEPHRRLLESLPRAATVQAFLLAVDGLTRREYPEPRIFILLQEFLSVINSIPEDILPLRTMLFNAAVLKLLDTLGHGLELNVCVSCRQRLSLDDNALNILRGGIECANCRSGTSDRISGDLLKVLRFLRSAPLRTVPALRLESVIARQVSFLTDVLLTSHLEARFDPLRYMHSI
jgi:DNA repair protein RecO (recombination protein O)